jgi:hypothetical protein
MRREGIVLSLAAFMALSACHKAEANKAASNAREAQPIKPQPVPPVATATDSLIKPGIYGDVEYDEESGDLSGVEFEILPGPEHRVEVTLCEGWCNSIEKAVYNVTESGIAFSYRETLTDQTGKQVPGEVFSFDVRPAGRGVQLRGNWFAPKTAKLKRLTERYGLDGAARNMKTRGKDAP